MKNMRCELKSENYIVAFVDILGASKKIKNDPDKSLNVVHDVYEYVLHYLKAFCEDVDLIEAKPIFRVFSDNIIIAVPVEPHGINAAFLSAAIHTALVQNHFLVSKYLTRGGMSMGGFFSDEIMVWGQALVSAYEIENSISIYPRVVVHPDLIKEIDITDSSICKYLKKDNDGLYFIDYLFEFLPYGEEGDTLLSHYFNDCKAMRVEESENIKSIQKISWFEKYTTTKLKSYSDPVEDGDVDV